MSDLQFTPHHHQKPGTIATILKLCYADLVSSEPALWSDEIERWKRFDADIYENPATIGDCTFLSWHDDDLVGFASYDPRQWPSIGIIGHNGILPRYQGLGFGKQQAAEILRRFRKLGFKRAKVSTLDHVFFIPAQRMYLACGFYESRRIPWERSAKYKLIEYEMDLR